MERAKIAACDTAPPPTVAKPAVLLRSRLAASDGVKSSAIKTALSGKFGFSCTSPVISRKTRLPTSRTSFARAASMGFFISANFAAVLATVCCHANAALRPFSTKACAAFSISGSSSNSPCALKIAADSTPVFAAVLSYKSVSTSRASFKAAVSFSFSSATCPPNSSTSIDTSCSCTTTPKAAPFDAGTP